ncbi:hypothetical protein GCM10009744_47780 [Kribbella alba]|uniref:Tetratricopeptide repeat protein n=1 Tax=Kribbella alba TaxID=190197 RepID=A0ABP4RH67_9ACTN
MSALHGGGERNIIPRWRRFGKTVRVGELKPLHVPQSPEVSTVGLNESLAAYASDPGLHTAGDVLSQAVVLGFRSPEIDAAARYVITAPNQTGRIASQLAERVVNDSISGASQLDSSPLIEVADFRLRVRQMRGILQREPRNSIRWTDLALAYVNLGLLEQAERAMRVALSLSPSNRYVLRSAVRLYLLLDRPDQARFVLRDDDLLRDPWIHASELSLAEILERPARKMRAARTAVEEDAFAPWHLSELASELATIDLRAGKVRHGKQLLRRALVSPTENTIAQVKWVAIESGIDIPAIPGDEPPLLHEAKAREFEQAGKYLEALEEAMRWQIDQPFDPEPALFGSYVAAMALERYDTAIDIAERGLRSNPANTMLRNNLVFSLASVGRIEDAAVEAAKMETLPDTKDQAVTEATRGLVDFRSGNTQAGRARYQDSVSTFRRNEDSYRAALATFLWAREELIAGTPEALNVLEDATKVGSGSGWRLVEMWRSRLSAMVAAGSEKRPRKRRR